MEHDRAKPSTLQMRDRMRKARPLANIAVKQVVVASTPAAGPAAVSPSVLRV
jgi:hypothetical protein